MPASSNPSLAITIPGMLPALPIRNRELVQLHGRVNLQAASSLSSNGADLPCMSLANFASAFSK